MEHAVELTILMPCLNEARTLPVCIRKALAFLQLHQIDGEVLIADNGSTDGSSDVATACGARVVNVARKGYGAALMGGIEQARGRYVVMGDADDSYDFTQLSGFVERLRGGDELVVGNRFSGGIAPGAMPALHRYLGNPVLSFVGRRLFTSSIGDFHCGLRGFHRNAILRLGLQTSGMEFASEMIVKAAIFGLRISEVPTTLSPDGRDRPPHLRSWRDGWRHLRFLLAFSPSALMLTPGLVLAIVGGVGSMALLPGPLQLGSVILDIHSLLYACSAWLLGLLLCMLAVLTNMVGIAGGVLPARGWVEKFARRFTLELGLMVAIIVFAGGALVAGYSVLSWESAGFGPLEPRQTMRVAIPAVTLMLSGALIGFFSFTMWFIATFVRGRFEQ